MKKENLTKKNIPNTPGVYFFLGARKEILYIGKATSLSNRVRSYFTNDIAEKRSKLIEQMVEEAKTVEWTETDSVLEALILETNLIRTHTPKYNTISKDNKSFNHLIITKEEFPRVLVVRGKDLVEQYDESDIQYHFGPFPNSALFKEALKIIQRIFQFYDTPTPVGKEKSKMAKGKVDFNRQIGLYPDVQSREEYKKIIRHIRLFFEGKKQQVIKELEKEMKSLAQAEKFEKAGEVKKRIFALQHIQDVALIKDDARVYRDEKNVRIEGYDVAHLQGGDMVGVMTVISGLTPQKEEYRKFKIQSVTRANDTAALKEILERRLTHTEWEYPQVIVVDGSTAQKNAAQRVLEDAGVVIPVVGVVKNAQHKPQRIIGSRTLIEKYHDSILLVNAEAHRFAISYHRGKRKLTK